MKNIFEKSTDKFSSEKEMALKFGEFLFSNFKSDDIECFEEVKGLFGIPDYLLVEKESEYISFIISVELKLKDWRKGLKQGFKYKSFSNLTIVVLDDANITPALSNLDQFIHFDIGLASFDTCKNLKLHFIPSLSEPFSPHLVRRVIDYISTEEATLTLAVADIYIEKWNSSSINKKISTYSVCNN